VTIPIAVIGMYLLTRGRT